MSSSSYELTLPCSSPPSSRASSVACTYTQVSRRLSEPPSDSSPRINPRQLTRLGAVVVPVVVLSSPEGGAGREGLIPEAEEDVVADGGNGSGSGGDGDAEREGAAASDAALDTPAPAEEEKRLEPVLAVAGAAAAAATAAAEASMTPSLSMERESKRASRGAGGRRRYVR